MEREHQQNDSLAIAARRTPVDFFSWHFYTDNTGLPQPPSSHCRPPCRSHHPLTAAAPAVPPPSHRLTELLTTIAGAMRKKLDSVGLH